MWLVFDGKFWMIRVGGGRRPSAVTGRVRAFVYDDAPVPTMLQSQWTLLKSDGSGICDTPPKVWFFFF